MHISFRLVHPFFLGQCVEFFKISTRSLTITADVISKEIADLDPELTYQITDGNKLDAHEFIGALEREQGEEVGVYTILIGDLTLGSNYEITFINAGFTINSSNNSQNTFTQESVNFYPNPVEDQLFINLDSGLEIKEIQVFDLLGKRKKVIKGAQSSIYLGGLPKGIYYIRYRTNLGTGSKSIVKK
jgi:hypothetical protein